MPAGFQCTLKTFADIHESRVIGELTTASAAAGFETHYLRQTTAWGQQIRLLKDTAKRLIPRIPASERWSLLLEFDIPRRGKRPDAVLLAEDLIFLMEFKVGAAKFSAADVWQTLSYALDLRDFHAESSNRLIFPILIATRALRSIDPSGSGVIEHVHPVICVGNAPNEQLTDCIVSLHGRYHNPLARVIVPSQWEAAAYRPIPSIIEAAERLFAKHRVIDISHAFARNLSETSSAIIEAIVDAKKRGARTICFVTGIPGAGKTLAGLNAAHDPSIRAEGGPAAVFLSGNGPLVKVVREALIRDACRRGATRRDAARTVSTFINNVHGFIKKYGLEDQTSPPYEHAIIFDEAQRAWNAEAVLKKHGVGKSEPELVLEIMERARGWAVVVALVGGGQEIHAGEAGLQEWGRALSGRLVPWTVIASTEALEGGASLAGAGLLLDASKSHLSVHQNPHLHLNVSVRSTRASTIAEWVNSVVSGDGGSGSRKHLGQEFPIALTRNLDAARRWLRERADGAQRCGLLASSGAMRLRAEGLEVSSGFRGAYSYNDWFLSRADDTRSSLWLEVAATEFECQGLELDWTAVCWGGDFQWRPTEHGWVCRRFLGTRWRTVRREETKQYIANKYRVLLTRARRGMVIYVPRGSLDDPTRDSTEFESTAQYLEGLGAFVIDDSE